MSKGLATPFSNTGSTNIAIVRPSGSINVPVTISVMTPDLPVITPDVSTLPIVTGFKWTCNTSADLTTALASCSLGDEIILTAGNTFAGTFTLRNITSGIGWVFIHTSATGSLPARNTRVTPCDATNMATITVPSGGNPAIQTAPSAHHYWILGVEVTNATGVTFSYGAIGLGDGSSAQNNLSLVPHHLVIDRCYIHGSHNFDCTRGIALNCGWAAIVDSYISEWHDAPDGSDKHDTQAICGWNGTGPFLIQNNHVEAGGENLMIGGSDPAITNQLPSDITISKNHIYKPPAWYGIFEVKSHLELKLSNRALLDGNIFENEWADAQDGTSIEFKSVNQNGTAPWSQTVNVTFRNNIVRNTVNALNLAAHPETPTVVLAGRMLIYNNLFYKIGDGDYGTQGRMFTLSGIVGLTIDHNTAFNTQNFNFIMIVNTDEPQISQLVVTNNILGEGNAIFVADTIGNGLIAFTADAAPGWACRQNVVIGPDSSVNPPNNYYPATISNVNVDPNTHKLPSGSIYLLAATDGTMIGANIDVINSETSGVDVSNKARVTFVSNFDSTNSVGTLSYKSPTFNAVAGNTIVVGVKGLATSSFAPVITDTAHNSYNLVRTDYISGGNGLALYECHNCLANAANEVQFADAGSTFKAIAVGQYSGCWRTQSPLDVSVGGHGIASGSYTTTPAINGGAFDEIMVLLATDSLGGTLTIPATFTTRTTSGITFADQLIPNIFNTTCIVSSSNSSDVVQSILAVFK